jgi:ribonuclease VapC
MVLAKYVPNPVGELAELLIAHGIDIEHFTSEHAAAACEAFLRYGKGRHPAGLNFGDCMSYAVAKLSRMPLLYVGGDFAKTDVQSA